MYLYINPVPGHGLGPGNRLPRQRTGLQLGFFGKLFLMCFKELDFLSKNLTKIDSKASKIGIEVRVVLHVCSRLHWDVLWDAKSCLQFVDFTYNSLLLRFSFSWHKSALFYENCVRMFVHGVYANLDFYFSFRIIL